MGCPPSSRGPALAARAAIQDLWEEHPENLSEDDEDISKDNGEATSLTSNNGQMIDLTNDSNEGEDAITTVCETTLDLTQDTEASFEGRSHAAQSLRDLSADTSMSPEIPATPPLDPLCHAASQVSSRVKWPYPTISAIEESQQEPEQLQAGEHTNVEESGGSSCTQLPSRQPDTPPPPGPPVALGGQLATEQPGSPRSQSPSQANLPEGDITHRHDEPAINGCMSKSEKTEPVYIDHKHEYDYRPRFGHSRDLEFSAL
ncbi:hypothetical protein DV736_g2959, partial [Chaetothyriales sp. CBS 134916]